jgi:hypothetical protein
VTGVVARVRKAGHDWHHNVERDEAGAAVFRVSCHTSAGISLVKVELSVELSA